MSITKSSVECTHGKGFNCNYCWPKPILYQFKIDLVLLDLMMPRMSGYATCEKMRQQFDLHELPIIILTAKNQIGDLIQGFKLGANDYITKPFYKEELLARVKTHLHAKNAQSD